jgi:hypothetical protein
MRASPERVQHCRSYVTSHSKTRERLSAESDAVTETIFRVAMSRANGKPISHLMRNASLLD